ncbi:hypothetical protein [Cryobacterium sp. Y11]|uniref:hypothetical protein n=1 Tax=Cryobacterium sp. Y11 TaxID=2045016 RepID=UPI000CE4886D|nr:hypothetical protein [Cryobacterium sp. Y11]
MSYLTCITNDLDDVRSCVVNGQHASNCDGREWQYDREAECSYPTNNECGGCLPAPAEHGMLCWSCYAKTRDALKIALDMITHLCSISRAQQLDNNGVRASATWILPVPNTWRTADELIMLLGHPAPGFPSDAVVWEIEAITERYLDAIDVDEWVARQDGAEAAVRFFRIMQNAMAQHPMADVEHKVKNVRCHECRQLNLVWKPPLDFDGPIHIVCSTPECGFVVDDTLYAVLAASQLEKVTSAMKETKAAELAEARAARAIEKRRITAAGKAVERAAEDAAIEARGAA